MSSHGPDSAVRYRTVLLDFDHTLFDSDTSERLAFAWALAEVGISDPDAYFDRYQSINRQLWMAAERGEISVADVGNQRWFRFVEEVGLDADGAVLTGRFGQGMAANGELYPGAADFLDNLAGRVTLALVTNALSEIQRARIERVGIGHYFESIVISSEVGVAKPSAGIFEVAFKQLQNGSKTAELLAKEHTVMIGDSLSSDIRGGSNFGIDTCWYNPSGHEFRTGLPGLPPPTHVAGSYGDIERILF